MGSLDVGGREGEEGGHGGQEKGTTELLLRNFLATIIWIYSK